MADESNGQDYQNRYITEEPELKNQEYLEELLREKHILSTSAYPHAARLVQEEVIRTQHGGRPLKDFRYADVYREKPTKVTVKVAIPFRKHPKFNFVGKLLGPKGNTLKRLQEETLCKMSILGRGSMRDKVKEEELRKTLDPKFAHLSDDLHVEISALAGPAEAYARIAYALAEIRKYLIPDSNDDISIGQLREMETYISPDEVDDSVPPYKKAMLRPPKPPIPVGRGGPPRGSSVGSMSRSQWPVLTKNIVEKPRPNYEPSTGYRRPDNGGYPPRSHSHEVSDYYPRRYGPPPSMSDNLGGRWKSSGSSRLIPRATPYNRPPK